ncbi:STAS domain-containing protein [Thiomicrospira sp. WB1]|uniref:STAS domain-containing protein n=1 Tax=Thiomicrospira sp. WB1 TaxID=1685380 RepID=UPI000747398E|nr:STAS domain-containing protein [Thiomicrospira sp. WB1]KUJ72778.1 hypothetical protein AVO41_03065 [Thiomicrospira sp. WB1]
MNNFHAIHSGDTLTITLPRSFNMASYEAFNTAYQAGKGTTEYYVLDFAQTHHLDSAALGLLLLLREHLDGQGQRIKLINLSESVERTLHTAQFQTLFDIPELSTQV